MAQYWAFINLLALVTANILLDPGRDPVLRRLEIPAQIIDSDSAIGDSLLTTSDLKPALQVDEPLQRLWSSPHTAAIAGKLFEFALPKNAFQGHANRFEVTGRDGKPLPPWLVFDPSSETIRGAPSIQDIGRWTVQVESISSPHVARDVFVIEVVDPSDCKYLTLSVLLDLDAEALSKEEELSLKRKLSSTFHTSPSATEIRTAQVDQQADWIRAGPGNTIRASQPHLVQLRTRLSCSANDNDPFWKHWKEMSSNGQLAKKLGAPVLGWHLSLEPSIIDRHKRDIEGSGDEYDDYNELEDFDENIEPYNRIVPSLTSPVFDTQPTPVLTTSRSVSSQIVSASKPFRSSKVTESMTSVEPTLVLTTPSTISMSVAPSTDENSSFILEPIEPTPSIPVNQSWVPEADVVENEVDDGEEQTPDAPPRLNNRLQPFIAIAGKAFRFAIPAETFVDSDGSTRSLALELVPSDGKNLSEIPWIGFNETSQEIYGLPLSDDIGKWNFTLQARNSANLTATEVAEIHVRQHQQERTFHHRFELQIEPEFSFDELVFPRAYWMVKIVRALAKVVGDKNADSIVVRNVEGELRNADSFFFHWSNESLSKTRCVEDEIDDIFEKIYNADQNEVTLALDDELAPQLSVTDGKKYYEGICKPLPTTPPLVTTEIPVSGRIPKPNTPPQISNYVDSLKAEVGVLFRYQVPEDTFFDEEDGNTRMLVLNLLNISKEPLNPKSWLQFDVPNQEFYGLPLESDATPESTMYQLRATDSGGLHSYFSLEVTVEKRRRDEEPVVEFTMQIDADFESLTTSAHRKARLVNALAAIFGDAEPRHVVVLNFSPGSVNVTWTNSTLYGQACPQATILNLRRILVDDEGKLTQRTIDILTAADFTPQSASLVPRGVCVGEFTPTHGPEIQAEKESEKQNAEGLWTDDYLLTFIVPGIIITVMLLLAAVIACVLYRRRRTGKLGLEERRGFVSKGIPIIFAEELEERPSGRHPAKAPVILKVMPCKEEKPAQPPPDYHKARPSSTSPQPHKTPEQRDLLRSPSEEADDEPAGLYQPPPPVSSASSGRNTRPKATSAYRKPPPYVPP